MTNPAISAKDLLLNAGVGDSDPTADFGIHVGQEPDSPDKTITIYNSPGSPPNPKWRLDYPSVQIRTRAAPGDSRAAWDKANEVKKALLGLQSQTVNGDRWVSVTMTGDISPLGADRNNRYRYTVTFDLIIEPDSTGDNRQALP